MFHRIIAGFFDQDAAVSCRKLVILRPLDLDKVSSVIREFGFPGDGQSFNVGKDVMTIEDGYVDCPWLTLHVNRKSVEFMLRLNEETACMFVDLGHRELVSVDHLQESLCL